MFYPSKLPQKDDSSVTKGASLAKEVLSALRSLQAHVPEQDRSKWVPCIKMVVNMLEIRDHFGGLVAKKMETALRGMVDGGTNILAILDKRNI